MAEVKPPQDEGAVSGSNTPSGTNAPSNAPSDTASKPPSRWDRRAVLGLSAAVVLIVAGGILWWQQAPQNGLAQDHDGKDKDAPRQLLFEGWGKPDLVLIVSGQMHGYLQPCGCSAPQYGGLARRYNFIKSLEQKGWPVVAVDVGDIAQSRGAPHDQLLLKYTTAMDALRLMRYTAIAPGRSEFEMPLGDAFGNYFANRDTPVLVAANLLDRERTFFNIIKAWTAEKSSPRVGVVGMVTKSLRDQLEKDKRPDARFEQNSHAVLENALKEMARDKVEFGVLLAQGKEFDPRPQQDKKDGAFEDAVNCAKQAAELRQKNPGLAPIHVIVWVTHDQLPPAAPKQVGNTWLVTAGHKGQRIGVVGIYKNRGGDFSLKYELVSVGPEFKTPEGQEKNNPVMALMEKYAQQVKQHDFMARFGRTFHPVQLDFPNAMYVGSERCGDCHAHAYNVWANPPKGQDLWHSHAYDTLEKVKHPSLRNFDGECIVCHTVGFEHKTGFYDKFDGTAKQIVKRNLDLRHVGCESCHGPGSVHIDLERAAGNPQFAADRAKMHKLMNPHKASKEELDPGTPAERRQALHKHRMIRIDISCQKCHDTDNDVHWSFDRSWPKVIHMTPRKGAPAGNGK